MHNVITPEPHFIPGYTGHCPRFMDRAGSTYGHLTHKVLLTPCAGHSKELVISPISSNFYESSVALPTKLEKEILKNRERFNDVVYRDPIMPGYEGFVPKMAAQVGKRFLAAATSGINEHEAEMEILRCERRHLKHADMIDSGMGLFEPKMNERLIPRTVYRSPLIPVKRNSAALPSPACKLKPDKVPYSKSTVPHFMKNDDEDKWIVSGYRGHIPFAKMRHGQSSKELSKSALTDFSDNYHLRRFDLWCNEHRKPSVGNSNCPSGIDYKIYNVDTGFLPNYSGHVPGHLYKVGLRFGLSTANAKSWLRAHRDIHCYDC